MKQAIFLFFLCFSFIFLFPFCALAEDAPDTASALNEDSILIGDIDLHFLLNLMQKKLYEKAVVSFADMDLNSEEQAAITVIHKGIRNKMFSFFFKDAPVESMKNLAITTLKLVAIVASLDLSEAIGELERISVEKAKEYLIKTLLQNEIKVGKGNLKYLYKTYREEPAGASFQYLMAHKEIAKNTVIAAADFYSPEAIDPPKLSVNTPCDYKEELKPFILRITGEIEKYWWGGYGWKEEPEIEVIFNQKVPKFSFKDAGFFERTFNDLKGAVRAIENAGKGVRDFIGGVGNLFKDMGKSAESSLFGANLASIAEQEMAQQKQLEEEKLKDLETKMEAIIKERELQENQEKIDSPPAIGESLAVEPVYLPQESEPKSLSLEEIQETLDDIAEKIDVINREISALNGNVADSNQEGNEPISKNEIETASEPAEPENENNNQQQSLASVVRISGGSVVAEISYCQTSEGILAQKDKIIINKAGWMGNDISANNEWIELKNISSETIDISDWQILDKDKQIKIIIEENSLITPDGLYLLERTDDNSVPDRLANQIYTGALNNENEELRLFDRNCVLQDEILANPNWPSTEVVVPKIVLINEIQIDSIEGTGGTNDDWIELYNPNDFDVSLAGWSVQKHGSDNPCSIEKSFYKKNFSDDDKILAKGFFLIVSTKANDSLKNKANMEIGWSLSKNSTVYLVSKQERIENGEDFSIVDRVGFGSESCFSETAPAENPPEAKSIKRKELGVDTNNNSLDFVITNIPDSSTSIVPENLQSQIFIDSLGENNYFGSPAIDSSGNIYFISSYYVSGQNQGGIYSFSPSGEQRWFFPRPEFNNYYLQNLPILDEENNTLFVNSLTSLVLLNTETGELKKEISGDYSCALFKEQGELRCLSKSGENDLSLVSFSKEGEIMWSYPIGKETGSLLNALVVVDSSGFVYFGQGDAIFSLDSGGNLRWKRSFTSNCQYFSCNPKVSSFSLGKDNSIHAIVIDETDFSGMIDSGTFNCLHFMNSEKPEEEYREPKCQRLNPHPPLILGDNTVVTSFTSMDIGGTLHTGIWGFNASTSDWQIVLNGMPNSPLVADKNGIIYTVFNYNTLKIMEPVVGERKSILMDNYRADYISLSTDALYIGGTNKMYIVK